MFSVSVSWELDAYEAMLIIEAYLLMIFPFVVVSLKLNLLEVSNLSLSLSMVFNLKQFFLLFSFIKFAYIELNSVMMIINATDSNRFGKTKLLVSM